jgi:hypothetical protein
MVDANLRSEHLFVVRVWREAGTRGRSCRGYVVHVPTKQRMYFSELGDLLEFIRLRFDGAGVPPVCGGGATAENHNLRRR